MLGQGRILSKKGAGWSNRMMVDDWGHYGFGGLCAGTVALRAYLAGGQASLPGQVSVNGKDSFRVDLRTLLAGATAGAVPTSMGQASAVAQPSPIAQPNMPAAGHSGWLLVGGALWGALLLLTAGARRVLGARSRPRSNQK